MKASRALRLGRDGIAPSLVMHRKPAALANSSDCLSLSWPASCLSSKYLTTKAAVKQSPAPVVSTML